MLQLAPVDVIAERRDGALYLRSGHPLQTPPATLGDVLRAAAAEAPDRVALAERIGPNALREVTYAEALSAAEGIAARLAERAPVGRPVLALAGNSVDHALLMFGAYLAGVPVASISVAYALMSADHGKLRQIVRTLRPGLIYAAARGPYAKAIAAAQGALARPVEVITSDPDQPSEARLSAWMGPPTRHQQRLLAEAQAEIGPETVAKILFTSGSTGAPKGVPNTHRMLTSNQQMIAQLWPFLADEPPVLVDWLPWSHTFGGNHNLHLALFNRGTLLIDDGKPRPDLVERTLRNLRAMPPTLYFNVPAGFAALVPRLEQDAALRDTFFSRLRVIFYAGAALPDDLWQRLVALAEQCTDRPPFMTTAWGSTETAPLATSAHFPLDRAGNIGVPAPGVTLKLVPNGSKQEVRVAGPNVMAGYLDAPELSAAAFDEEGFYRIGDAVKLADPDDPAAGLLFDGRVSEDFKLTTGTWVNVGRLRTGLLTACSPALHDLVVAGHDRPALGVLAWLNPAGCRALVSAADAEAAAQMSAAQMSAAALARHPAVRAHLDAAMRAWNAAHPQSSARVARLLLLDAPPDIDAGEVTDKGYINQRATLERRGAAVEALFGDGATLTFD